MAKSSSNLIGIAVTENSVHVADCRGMGASAKAGKRSSFDLDGALLFDQPERFGEALADHLKQEGYRAKHAVVGLGSRWVLARQMALPPVEGDALAGMVRLKIEGEFAGGSGDLVFDYQDAPPVDTKAGSGPRGLLVVGMPRRRLEKVQAALATAGLELERVGATPLDLCTTADDGLSLIIDPAGITLTRAAAGKCAGFAASGADTRSLNDDPAAAASLAGAAARLAMTGFAEAAASTSKLNLIDTAGLNDAARSALASALRERFGGCTATSADPALAAARSAGSAGSVNLLRSKLAIKPKRGLPGYAKWVIRAAVLLLLVGLAVGYFWVDANRELAALQDEYDAIRDNATRLQAVREDSRAASGWFDDRPPVLDCLLELTHTFPREGRIWVTSLNISPDATGTVSCRADDEGTMWLYVNAMNASPRLTNVVLRRQNDAGRQAGEIVFDVSFRYDATAPREEEEAL